MLLCGQGNHSPQQQLPFRTETQCLVRAAGPKPLRSIRVDCQKEKDAECRARYTDVRHLALFPWQCVQAAGYCARTVLPVR